MKLGEPAELDEGKRRRPTELELLLLLEWPMLTEGEEGNCCCCSCKSWGGAQTWTGPG